MRHVTTEPRPIFDLELKLLVDAVYARYRYDFRGYALGPIRRRVRYAMDRLGYVHLSDLQHRLMRDRVFFIQAVTPLTVAAARRGIVVPVPDHSRAHAFATALHANTFRRPYSRGRW